MGSLEERVAYLEGKVEEHAHASSGLRQALGQFEQRVDRRFEALDRRFEILERAVHSLDDRMSRQFMWLVGLQLTTLVAILSALVARGDL